MVLYILILKIFGYQFRRQKILNQIIASSWAITSRKMRLTRHKACVGRRELHTGFDLKLWQTDGVELHIDRIKDKGPRQETFWPRWQRGDSATQNGVGFVVLRNLG
jgi:hypothetical protein